MNFKGSKHLFIIFFYLFVDFHTTCRSVCCAIESFVLDWWVALALGCFRFLLRLGLLFLLRSFLFLWCWLFLLFLWFLLSKTRLPCILRFLLLQLSKNIFLFHRHFLHINLDSSHNFPISCSFSLSLILSQPLKLLISSSDKFLHLSQFLLGYRCWFFNLNNLFLFDINRFSS